MSGADDDEKFDQYPNGEVAWGLVYPALGAPGSDGIACTTAKSSSGGSGSGDLTQMYTFVPQRYWGKTSMDFG